MGREIRRVPPDWKHPLTKYCIHQPTCKRCYQPMYERSYDEACSEWIDDFKKWNNGERDEYFNIEENKEIKYWWDWEGMPPERDYYNTFYSENEATWYQVYETVSEGTPVSPPFETQEELINYLVVYGDFWAQQRNTGGISREQAEKFVLEDGYLYSMTVRNGILKSGYDQLVKKESNE